MPAEGPAHGGEVVGLAALGLVVCCGLPVLLSVAAGATVVGVGLGSWLLGAVGLVIAGATVWRYRRRRVGAGRSDDRRGC